MAGEAAVNKVMTGLQEWMGGEIGAGVRIDVNRPFDVPYQDNELPAVNIRVEQIDFDIFNYSGWLHTAAIMFDTVTRSSTLSTIDAEQAEIQASIVARLAARVATAGTIGELLQTCDPVSAGPPSPEDERADVGESTLAYRMTWLTPQNDFRTIAGHNGLVP